MMTLKETGKIPSHFRKIYHTIYLLVPFELARSLNLKHNQPVDLCYEDNPTKKIVVTIEESEKEETPLDHLKL